MKAGREETGVNDGMKKWDREEWLKRRDRITFDRYRAQRVAVKLAVQAVKIMADGGWGEQLGNNFEGNTDVLERGKASEER